MIHLLNPTSPFKELLDWLFYIKKKKYIKNNKAILNISINSLSHENLKISTERLFYKCCFKTTLKDKELNKENGTT